MRKILIGLVIVTLAVSASATIRLVPQQYATVQAGINAANAGDTVLVAAGVYVENLLMRESVSLFGSGMDKTIIDGGGLANVITSPYGVLNLVISDLSVRNSEQSGSAPGCIGIHLNPNASGGVKVVRRCHISHCGHGIQIWNDFGGTVTIEYNVINDNLFDGFYPYLGIVYLRNNTIVNNGRDGYNDNSGGGNVVMQNNIIASNARYGIYRQPSTPISSSYNDVWNNSQGNYMQGSPPSPFTPSPGTGEISASPMFIGPPYPLHDQFYIVWANFPTPDSSKSPCIDAGNPGVQYNDPDGTRSDIGALGFNQRVSNVEIIMVPVLPWVLPPQGGNLNYDARLENLESFAQTCQVWNMVILPNGNLYGPVAGPISVTLPASANIIRNRTQVIHASAPPGTYLYQMRTGNYPANLLNISSAPFTKQAGDTDNQIGDWAISSDSFDDQMTEPQQNVLQPETSMLAGVYPNPFNATATITFQLSALSFVNLSVYDVAGQKVMELIHGIREAGRQNVTFDGSALPSGVYLYRLTAGQQTTSGKMVLLK